jgi:RNA polymerase sigma factor for flagellar operon FliA
MRGSARRAIEAARSTVETLNSGAATAPEIAARMGLSLKTYYNMEADTRAGAHEPLDDVDADNIALVDDTEQADELLDRRSQHAFLRDAILALDKRSQLVLQLYFFEEMNLEEIGRVLNVGAARVCQIKSAALLKLRVNSALADCLA